jgi:hypothetical protein
VESARAHHFRVTHQLACHGERPARPPDQRRRHTTTMPAADEYTLITIHAHKAHHCHHTTRRHRPISRSCLLPHCCHRAAASPCALLPGDNIPHTPHARRLAPPPLPPPTPWIAPGFAHLLCPTHRDFPACHPRRAPPTATPRRGRQPILLPITRPCASFVAFPAARRLIRLAPGGGVPQARALCWRSARSPFLGSPPRPWLRRLALAAAAGQRSRPRGAVPQ